MSGYAWSIPGSKSTISLVHKESQRTVFVAFADQAVPRLFKDHKDRQDVDGILGIDTIDKRSKIQPNMFSPFGLPRSRRPQPTSPEKVGSFLFG